MRMTSLSFCSALLLTAAAAAAQDLAGPPEPERADETPLAAPAAESDAVIRNADVIEMVGAGFGDSTIVAAIEANATAFDVTPRELLALKRAGVSDPVIEAMLAVKRQVATPVAAEAPAPRADAPAAPTAQDDDADDAEDGADSISPEAFAALSRMIEQLADAPPPPPAPADATSTHPKLEPEPQPENPHAPRAWVADGAAKVPIAPTVAKVAYTDMKRSGTTAFKTLQGLAGKALPFVNPALGAATSGLSSLFRNDDPATTAVWALLGSSSARELSKGAAFEIEFGNVPGVDPDRYQPAIVQLVPTSDNYRLVGAAKTEGESAAAPSGPIIEEPVAADLMQLARGRYRVALGGEVPSGEYALVLRPVEQPRERERRRNNDSSLGDLMGAAATSHVIYLTWDFSITG